MKIVKIQEIKTRLVYLEDEIDLSYSGYIEMLCDLLKIDYYTELISIKHDEIYIDNGQGVYVYKVKYKKEL